MRIAPRLLSFVHTLPVTCLSKCRRFGLTTPQLRLAVLYYYEKLTLHSLPVQLANLVQVCTDFFRTFTLNSYLFKQPTAIRLPFGHTTPDLRRRDTFLRPIKTYFVCSTADTLRAPTFLLFPYRKSPSVINTRRPPNSLLRLRFLLVCCTGPRSARYCSGIPRPYRPDNSVW